MAPIVVGGGTPWLPDDIRVPLELLDERRFAGGMVYLRYRLAPLTRGLLAHCPRHPSAGGVASNPWGAALGIGTGCCPALQDGWPP